MQAPAHSDDVLVKVIEGLLLLLAALTLVFRKWLDRKKKDKSNITVDMSEIGLNSKQELEVKAIIDPVEKKLHDTRGWLRRNVKSQDPSDRL